MSAIATTADGQYIYAALEDGSGNQVVMRAERDDLSTWTTVYAPGGGSACNVIASIANPDLVIFYGHFGTDAQVIAHSVSTNSNADISPPSLGAQVINTFGLNPGNADVMYATVDTAQDLLQSIDGGATWATLNSALGVDATALLGLYNGQYFPDTLFFGGVDTLLYSPNEGATLYLYTELAGETVVGLA